MKRSAVTFMMMILAVVFTFSLISFNSPSSTFDPHRVGDVVYSVLDLDNFKKEHGEGWVLMDGESISGTRLQTDYRLLNSPNALGMFLRGMNDKTKGGADTVDRKVGSPQEDAFQGHHHEFGDEVVIVNNGSAAANKVSNYITISQPADNKVYQKELLKKRNYIQAAKTDGTNGQPRISTETRPKNVSLFIYLKVND